MKTKPIQGAALYEAIGKEVWMTDDEGYSSCIQTCKTFDGALQSAEKWQIKENKSVAKSQK